jgi:hypothetical protein
MSLAHRRRHSSNSALGQAAGSEKTGGLHRLQNYYGCCTRCHESRTILALLDASICDDDHNTPKYL